MNNTIFKIGVKTLIISYLCFSCTSKPAETEMDTAHTIGVVTQTDTINAIPNDPNLVNGKLANKKFIRTAESKFRVIDVKKATQKI